MNEYESFHGASNMSNIRGPNALRTCLSPMHAGCLNIVIVLLLPVPFSISKYGYGLYIWRVYGYLRVSAAGGFLSVAKRNLRISTL